MSEAFRGNCVAALTAHAARYPLMRPADAVKLIYQNEFGGGHLISDPEASLRRLREEAAETQRQALPPLESIGGGMCRAHLGALDEARFPLDLLNRDFVRSAALRRGDRARFLEKLDALRELTASGAMPFDAAALEAYLTPYIEAGCPMVSHSDVYRAAYRPAYRVLLREASLTALLVEAHELLAEKGRVVIALDGRCASGKTTLAALLRQRFGWNVVHMDDFYLRPEQRTPERYATPGENVDHERFLQELLLPLSRGETVRYRPLECGTFTLAAPVALGDSPVTVVEGSYSMHPSLRAFYDIRAFLTISPDAQMERIRRRNGAMAEMFRTKWIPMEEAYFAALRPQDICAYRFEAQPPVG